MNEHIWNCAILIPPPINSFRAKSVSIDLNSVQTMFTTAIRDFKPNSYLHADYVALHRCVYRHKHRFRSDKGFKFMEKTTKLLKHYFDFDLVHDLHYFMESLPKQYESDMYLPTKQMLEYVLVRLQGFARITHRIVESAENTARFMNFRLKLGHIWETAAVILALVSRIWHVARYYTKKCCEFYNEIVPLLEKLQLSGQKWLPEECELPQDLGRWLNAAWLEDMADLGPHLPVDIPIFSLLDDSDDEDVQFCYQYKLNDCVVIDDDTVIDNDVEFIANYISQSESDGSDIELLDIFKKSRNRSIAKRLTSGYGDKYGNKNTSTHDIGVPISRSNIAQKVISIEQDEGENSEIEILEDKTEDENNDSSSDEIEELATYKLTEGNSSIMEILDETLKSNKSSKKKDVPLSQCSIISISDQSVIHNNTEETNGSDCVEINAVNMQEDHEANIEEDKEDGCIMEEDKNADIRLLSGITHQKFPQGKKARKTPRSRKKHPKPNNGQIKTKTKTDEVQQSSRVTRLKSKSKNNGDENISLEGTSQAVSKNKNKNKKLRKKGTKVLTNVSPNQEHTITRNLKSWKQNKIENYNGGNIQKSSPLVGSSSKRTEIKLGVSFTQSPQKKKKKKKKQKQQISSIFNMLPVKKEESVVNNNESKKLSSKINALNKKKRKFDSQEDSKVFGKIFQQPPAKKKKKNKRIG